MINVVLVLFCFERVAWFNALWFTRNLICAGCFFWLLAAAGCLVSCMVVVLVVVSVRFACL